MSDTIAEAPVAGTAAAAPVLARLSTLGRFLPVPTRLSFGGVQDADVVVTMGCGDIYPVFPGKRYEDWPAAVPKHQDLDTGRGLLTDLHVEPAAPPSRYPDLDRQVGLEGKAP